MDAHDDVPGLTDVDLPMLRKEVVNLASEMTGYFKDENHQRDAALPCLNRIFWSVVEGSIFLSFPLLALGPVSHNTADHGAGSITTEFKKLDDRD